MMTLTINEDGPDLNQPAPTQRPIPQRSQRPVTSLDLIPSPRPCFYLILNLPVELATAPSI